MNSRTPDKNVRRLELLRKCADMKTNLSGGIDKFQSIFFHKRMPKLNHILEDGVENILEVQFMFHRMSFDGLGVKGNRKKASR